MWSGIYRGRRHQVIRPESPFLRSVADIRECWGMLNRQRGCASGRSLNGSSSRVTHDPTTAVRLASYGCSDLSGSRRKLAIPAPQGRLFAAASRTCTTTQSKSEGFANTTKLGVIGQVHLFALLPGEAIQSASKGIESCIKNRVSCRSRSCIPPSIPSPGMYVNRSSPFRRDL